MPRWQVWMCLGWLLLPGVSQATDYGKGYCDALQATALTLATRRDAYRAGLGLPAITPEQVRKETVTAAGQNKLPAHCQPLATADLRVRCQAAVGLDFWINVPAPGGQSAWPLPDGSQVLCPSGEVQAPPPK